MKTIVLIRHAKSDKKSKKNGDFERPLSKRGKKDAPLMGKILKSHVTPDLILTSPAERAMQTAQSIASEYGLNGETVQANLNLYMEPKSIMLNVIKQTDNRYNTIFVVGHNPGVTDLINYLSLESVDNLPTSGAFAVSFDTESWADIDSASGKLLFYEFPKKNRKEKDKEEEKSEAKTLKE